MIPVGDNAPRWTKPWVNYAIIAACVLAFLYELSLGSGFDAFVRRYAVVPAAISAALAGEPRVPTAVLGTLVTSAFLHGGWLHLGSNMLFLWIFGDNVEDRLGHWVYLLFYLVCGVGAGLAQVLVDPASRIPLIGASGAIAGVLGAYLVLYPRAWVTVLVPVLFIFLPLRVPVLVMLVLWFLTQLASGVAAITTTAQASGGVGYWAHIGGFVLGVVLLAVLPKRSESIRRQYLPDAYGGSGLARAARGLVSFIGQVVDVLLIARVLVLLLAPTGRGLLAYAGAFVIDLSWPLVIPFAGLLPAVRLDGSILELYTLLAIVFYHLLISVVLWFLSAARQRRSWYSRPAR